MREPGTKLKGAGKTEKIPVKIVPKPALRKPAWIRVKAASEGSRFYEIKDILRAQKLHTVCEEASCPNIGECFGKGTATFMIMGDKCTRRCPFCDVGHGRPDPLDANEPENLARTIAALKLKYVVITSVDRDDLRDGGAQHFLNMHTAGTQAPLIGATRRSTFHPLGGVTMGFAADTFGRVHGYRGLYVVDGALIGGSTPTANPAWTIAALAERAMATILAEDLA